MLIEGKCCTHSYIKNGCDTIFCALPLNMGCSKRYKIEVPELPPEPEPIKIDSENAINEIEL